MKKIFLILFILGVANSISIPFQDCGSEYTLTQIDVENCKFLPCPVYMQAHTHFNITLNAPFASKYLYQDITIITKAIKTKVTTSPSTCEGTRSCPVHKGDASFHTNLWTPDIAPFPSTLQWIITNESDQKIMCFYLNILLCDDNYPNEKCQQ